ncbi:MAG: hypothetical protein E4H10_08820 [Bacteroidia bacterium]|nr:MAG: hypothetical protein E4H10_08820 [Bacteroidia bacterium]
MNKIILYFTLSLLLISCNEKSYDFEFVEINTPGNSSLRAICAVDENIVWTSGSQGKVYLSLDGGQNWHESSIPECDDTEFRSLHAWNANRALVFDVSPLGRAFMTKDGGETWKQVYQSPMEGAFFNSLKFSNDQQGVAISDPIDDKVFVLITNDGGMNWKRLSNLPSSVKGEINFAASNTCIEYLPSGEIYIVTGGSKSRVLTSHNHGENWEFAETPVMTGESAGLFSINFSTSSEGVAVGGDYNQPDREGIRAIFTEDGGLHWYEAENMPAEYRSCVVSLNDELYFAIGKTGCDYSPDHGKNWTFLDSTGYYAAHAVEGKNMIFLAGADGRVAKAILRMKP